MIWRLGIDLGTNSIGWSAIELKENNNNLVPCALKDSGSRIFSDGRNPKDKQSNAAKRREPKGARKNRDRYKRRRTRLMRQLIQFGLMPHTEADRKALEGGKGIPIADSDPWILRFRGVRQEIDPFQLGRALFHLHQRRGFKSNRKTDSADNEKGKVKEAIVRTKEQLVENGVCTIGELFGRERAKVILDNHNAPKGERKPQPLARVRKSGDGARWQYDYYPTRELVLDEFDLLWAHQKQYHEVLLTDEVRNALRDTIEWQHPLKSPPVGKCALITKEPRAPKALPSSQRARIFQEVNNLRIAPTGKHSIGLTKEERNIIVESLLIPTSKTAKRTFDQLRKIKGLSIYDGFNLESEKRKDLQGDETAALLMQENRWGKAWFDLDLATQDEIVTRLINDEEEEVLVNWLCDTHGLNREQAIRVADCPLPAGYGKLSKVALDKILPFLEADVTVYSDAVKQAGMDHSQFSTGEIFDQGLPYYGYILERSVAFGTNDPNDPDEVRYGKIANPTVHVALNQLRSVINDLIKRFGAPEQIVLELARDLPLSAKGRNELEKGQTKNRQDNESRAKELADTYDGQPNTYDNRMRLRLYEELEALGKRCVFTGQQIGPHNLFSSEVEIEHILPFSRTFDDGFNNKTLSMRKANRDKNNQTPFEAFGHSPDEYDWEEISKRAAELSNGKKWRFDPNAMERYEEFEGGFLARQLTDTQYISRLAKAYVEAIYGGQGYEGSKNNVWVINGRLTADLRHYWGLNSVLLGDNLPESEAAKKNRNDHRHHAIDAIVIACTDRSMLQKAAKEAQQNEQDFSGRLLAGIKEPWEGFRVDVENNVRQIIVSHKPDHGFQGAMHNDTAYGLVKGKDGAPDKKGARLVVTRKPLDSFEKSADLEKIRDDVLREKFQSATNGLSGKAFTTALIAAGKAMKPPVYKVRIEGRLSVIPMKDSHGSEYKAYKGDGNYCYDIWMDEKSKWTGEVISTYQAYQLSRTNKDWWRNLKGQDGQKLLMRLRKGDYLQLAHEGRNITAQIVKMSFGVIALAEHFEANVDARTRDKTSGLKYIFKSPSSLQKASTKYITVSPSGLLNLRSGP